MANNIVVLEIMRLVRREVGNTLACSSEERSSNPIDPVRLGAVHNGRPQRRGRGTVKCGHMRTGGGVKDPEDVRKMALLSIVSQTLPMGDAY